MRPNGFRLCLFTDTSSASSNTKFIYSSNPINLPSIRISLWSYSQIWIFCRLWRNLKIKFCRKNRKQRRAGLKVRMVVCRIGVETAMPTRRTMHVGRLSTVYRPHETKERPQSSEAQQKLQKFQKTTYNRLCHNPFHFWRHCASCLLSDRLLGKERRLDFAHKSKKSKIKMVDE